MSHPTQLPKITLVGAGPGDPDLLTVKAVKALQQANVVLYDALVHPDVLALAPASAEKIYVGKRSSNHRFQQETIEWMMVEYARSHGHVVRLKGGDPFVFGRGHEELVYARQEGIPVDIVPGISSCIAVPELQEVPVTRRGTSDSFWVLTGTTSEGHLSQDLRLAAHSNATIVVLMGLKKISLISRLFSQAGKSGTPAMIVLNGSMPDEKVLLGTVATLPQQLAALDNQAPGIIVIGEVVALHPAFAAQAAMKAAGVQAA